MNATQAALLEGRRQQVVAATIDTLSNAITLAVAINAPRVQVRLALQRLRQ